MSSKFTRVSHLISRYKKPFEAEKVAKRCAEKRGVTPESLLKEWANKSRNAIRRGNCIHSMIEHGNLHRWPDIANLLQCADQVRYEVTMHTSWGLKGTCDCLVKFPQDWVMYDWKTGKPLQFCSPYGSMKHPLGKLDDCNGVHYSLQQALYSILLKEVEGISIREAYLVHISQDDATTFYPVDLEYYVPLARLMLEHVGLFSDYDEELGF